MQEGLIKINQMTKSFINLLMKRTGKVGLLISILLKIFLSR